jgi:hypothetical protein
VAFAVEIGLRRVFAGLGELVDLPLDWSLDCGPAKVYWLNLSGN